MDKGQGSRNQIAKIEEFKGYVTSVDSPAMGIDVAEEMINVAYDLDGGIRKREGIKQDTSFDNKEREKIFFAKSRSTKLDEKYIEDQYFEDDTNVVKDRNFIATPYAPDISTDTDPILGFWASEFDDVWTWTKQVIRKNNEIVYTIQDLGTHEEGFSKVVITESGEWYALRSKKTIIWSNHGSSAVYIDYSKLSSNILDMCLLGEIIYWSNNHGQIYREKTLHITVDSANELTGLKIMTDGVNKYTIYSKERNKIYRNSIPVLTASGRIVKFDVNWDGIIFYTLNATELCSNQSTNKKVIYTAPSGPTDYINDFSVANSYDSSSDSYEVYVAISNGTVVSLEINKTTNDVAENVYLDITGGVENWIFVGELGYPIWTLVAFSGNKFIQKIYKYGMDTRAYLSLDSSSNILSKLYLDPEPDDYDSFSLLGEDKNLIKSINWKDMKSNGINKFDSTTKITGVKYIESSYFSKLFKLGLFDKENVTLKNFVYKKDVFPGLKNKAKTGEVNFKYSNYRIEIVKTNEKDRDGDNISDVFFYKDNETSPTIMATNEGAKLFYYKIKSNEDEEYSLAIIGDSIILSTGKNIYSFIPVEGLSTTTSNVKNYIVAGTLDEFTEDVDYEEFVITGLNRLEKDPLLVIKDNNKLSGFDFGVKDIIITDGYTVVGEVDNRKLSIIKEPNKDHYAFSQITTPNGFDRNRLNYEWSLFQLGDDQQWKEMKGSTLGWKGSVELNKTAIVNNIPGAWTINIKDDLKDRTTDKVVPWNLGENKKFTIIITASKIGDTTLARNYTLEGDIKVDESGLHYKFYTYGNLSTNDRFEGTLDKSGNFKLFRVLDGTHAAELENLNIIGVSQYQDWEVGISYPDMTKVVDNKTSETTFSKVATGKETFIKIDSYALNASTSYQLQLKVSYDEGTGTSKRTITQNKIINFVVKSRTVSDKVVEVKSLWDEMKLCKYVANFDDKLVLYGNGTQQIYTSELGRPYFITAEEIVKADSFGKGEDIVSIQNFKDTKIIFTKSTMMSMTGSGNTEANDPYHVLPLDGAVGCVGHLAVTPIENTLAFVGKDGIYMIEQISVAEQRVQLAKISSQINKEALPYFDVVDKVDEELFSDIVATNLEQRLIISYPQKEYMLVFDYGTDGIEKGKWTKWQSKLLNPKDFIVKENVLYILDSNINTMVFTKQPKITNDIYDQEYPVGFFTDDGIEYEFKYVSKYSDLGLPYEAKKIKRIFTATDNKWDGNVSYDVKFLADGYENINYHVDGNSYNRPLLKTGIQWGSLTTFRESHNIHSHIELISKPGRTIRMIITNDNDEPFALKGVQLEFTYSKAKGKQISK